jgi:hypothetical protein
MTEDFDYAGEGEQMFHGSPLPGGSYFTFTMPSDLHAPSLRRLDLARPPGPVEERLLLAVSAEITYTLSASTGTPSHFAAAARSVNSETCSGEWSVNMACNFG